jgi:serine phosphatase RsbU (regulator of sigma subunit)
MDLSARALIDWSASSQPRRGEIESGDQYLVTRIDRCALIAVIDGLGHGAAAAEAARVAVNTIQSHATQPLDEVARLSHDALRATRGAVMTLASIDCDKGTISWLGIGNVAAVILRAASSDTESLVLRGGVVGQRLPTVLPVTRPWMQGDTLVITTDGIRWDPYHGNLRADPTEVIVRRLVEQNADGDDDALVVVARCL